MRYIQGLEVEYNPEVVAFLMDHSWNFTWAAGSKSGPWHQIEYRDEAIQALLCERNFPDYAEC